MGSSDWEGKEKDFHGAEMYWSHYDAKKNRELELKTSFKELSKGRRKIAIKVVDIFGNDTMKIIEVGIGDKK